MFTSRENTHIYNSLTINRLYNLMLLTFLHYFYIVDFNIYKKCIFAIEIQQWVRHMQELSVH